MADGYGRDREGGGGKVGGRLSERDQAELHRLLDDVTASAALYLAGAGVAFSRRDPLS